MNFKIITFVFLFFSSAVFCQDKSLFEKKLFIKNNDTMPYRILLPLNYDAVKKYPLVLFLHGSGESGNDNEAQLVHGAELFLRDSIRKNYPAIVVFPQCSANSYWSNVTITSDSIKQTRVFNFPASGKPTIAMKLVMQLLNNLSKKYPLQKKQIYVAGLSMGGMGTFEIVKRNPNLFAAAISICGGANATIAPKLIKTKWSLFHGEKDNVVNVQYSKDIATAIKNAGGSVKLTIYPEANHNSWDSTFAENDFMQWLFNQHK